MAVLIGKLTAINGQTFTLANVDADFASPTDDGTPPVALSYGVGMWVSGMKLQLSADGTYGDEYTVDTFDVAAGTITIVEAGLTALDQAAKDAAETAGVEYNVYKTYEGAHGTQAEQSRKFLLGYI